MAISAVGSLAKGTSTATTTLAVAPTALGDVLVFIVNGFFAGTGTCALTPSGGGVTTWNRLKQNTITGTDMIHSEIWYGVITSTGSSTLTVTLAFTGGTPTLYFGCQQFTGGAGVTWSADGTGGAAGSQAPATSGNYPSLTPAGSGELYLGVGLLAGGSIGGSTAGFTYFNGSAGGFEAQSQFVYNPTASNPTAQNPAWTAASGVWGAVAAMLVATPPAPTKTGQFLEFF